MGNWGLATNGECDFADNLFYAVLFPGDYNPGCNCGIFNEYWSTPENPLYNPPPCPEVGDPGMAEYQACSPRACDFGEEYEGLNVVWKYGQTHVDATKFFVDIAVWVADHEVDTMQCFPAKGYWSGEEVIDEMTTRFTVHGHVLTSLDELDTNLDGFDNVHAPGTYWMEGGTHEFVSVGCKPLGDGGYSCPFALTEKIKGKYYDVCYELAQGLGIDHQTHCDEIDTPRACRKVNTCKWTDEGCKYSAGN